MPEFDDDFPYFTPSRPLPADGIRAKSRRGAIGETWWSQRFISVLEALHLSGRLTRGRSYARSGQVVSISVTPGLIIAEVQGSRPRPYVVRIGVKTLPKRDWERVETAMAGRAAFMARLLAGEMPQDIERAFAGCKLSLFPESLGALKTQCTCPDWGNPCKHIAATYYILAEMFDDDPFLIFLWRGKARGELIDALRARRNRSSGRDRRPAKRATGDGADPLAVRVRDFWTSGVAPTALHISPSAAHDPDAFARRLGPPPEEAGGADFGARLTRAYRTVAKTAERRSR